MSDLGCCIVAIPGDSGFPDKVAGGQHITLLYLGDSRIPVPIARTIQATIADVVSEIGTSLAVATKDIAYYGEDGDAVVIELDGSEGSNLRVLRERILDRLPVEARHIFDQVQTWPDYKPHMTLGYISEGYELPTDVPVPPYIQLTRIELWNGEWRDGQFLPGIQELMHYGILRKSGRYPWGSGETPNQRNKMFLDYVNDLQRKGMSEAQIAAALGMLNADGHVTTTQIRAAKAIAKNELKAADIATAQKLREKGMSLTAIGEKMGINESSVRYLLDPSTKDKNEVLFATADILKQRIEETGGMLDIGTGTELYAGVSRLKYDTAIAMLREEGYEVYNFNTDQLGTGKQTNMKVLAKPGTPYSDVYNKQDQIVQLQSFSDDGGRTFKLIEEPLSIDSSRVAVRYAEQGGGDADGVIYVRPGVKDLDMGGSQYAQVRIAVDGTHYLKGMAVIKTDLPDGVDLMFNTNKSPTGNKLDAMKALKDDPDNPFGAVVRQISERMPDGSTKVTSVMNIVNTDDDWDNWSKNLASQMLSKQRPSLAKQQLDLTYTEKLSEYKEIMSLTNPTVRKKLLESYSDSVDAAAVHLKAKALPGQKTHVILPVNSLKDNEIYAPNYKNGDRVALVRYPHGGIFEIPELVVNNRNQEGRDILGAARTAVGINAKVAGRLSGADFDGDTVLVIPNSRKQIKTMPALEELKGFDPQRRYPGYPGMKVMSNTQQEMGSISNLITDMTVKGANHREIARAVKHSMVVIDAEKHKLNYKQSAIDNGISELKRKYQGRADAGATTLISRASSDHRVPERKDRSAKDGGKINPLTGERMYTPTGNGYYKMTKSGKEVWVDKMTKTTKGAEAKDLHKLTSAYDNKGNKVSAGTHIEAIYANHGNKLKALANQARKSMYQTDDTPYSPSARKTYAAEVASLKHKVNVARKNAPLERQAQLVAKMVVKAKVAADPSMSREDIKKQQGIQLVTARQRIGASKTRVDITPREWEAIQSGAVRKTFLEQILTHTDLDVVKSYATPRTTKKISSAKVAKARSMMKMGYVQSEIAAMLGVSVSTLSGALNK